MTHTTVYASVYTNKDRLGFWHHVASSVARQRWKTKGLYIMQLSSYNDRGALIDNDHYISL